MKNINVNRSPLFYVGDKYKLISEIKPHFPTDIRHFVEPFVGGGSVYLNVNAQDFFLNDIDSEVIKLHEMLNSFVGKEQEFFDMVWNIVDSYGLSCSAREDRVPNDLKVKFVKTYFAEFNRSAFLKLREDYNNSHRDDYLMLYILLIYGFNRMIRFNKSGKYNLPVGNVDFNQNTIDALRNYFSLNASKETHWSALDFETFLNGLDLSEQDLIYLDPPYLITFSEYNKLWNAETEQRLLTILDLLSARNIRFAISNVTHYKGKINSIFLQWAERYNIHPIKSNYISYHVNTIKSFNEVLVTNY